MRGFLVLWTLTLGLTAQAQDTLRFEQAVACIKQFEGWHAGQNYIGYGHKVLPDELFSGAITEAQADSLLRVDLLQKCAVFRLFGRDSLLLGVLAYNVGEYRLLGGYGKPPSRLIQKLKAGDRDIYDEYVTFRIYRGKIHPGLERRRKNEFQLLYEK